MCIYVDGRAFRIAIDGFDSKYNKQSSEVICNFISFLTQYYKHEFGCETMKSCKIGVFLKGDCFISYNMIMLLFLEKILLPLLQKSLNSLSIKYFYRKITPFVKEIKNSVKYMSSEREIGVRVQLEILIYFINFCQKQAKYYFLF